MDKRPIAAGGEKPVNDRVPPIRTTGSDDNRGHRPSPGSGVVEGSGAGAGGGGNPEDFDDDPVGGGGGAPTPAGEPGSRSAK